MALYPRQAVRHIVGLEKLESWSLLLVIGFVPINLVKPPKAPHNQD